jgi:hypothetical protein
MSQTPQWLVALFLITDWSWFVMMVPIVAWYLMCLRWMDTHAGWEISSTKSDD